MGDVDGAFLEADRPSAPDELGKPAWPHDLDTRVLFAPNTSAMRRDHMPLAARLGLVDYWRSTGHRPDFCADPTLPYDCKSEVARLLDRKR